MENLLEQLPNDLIWDIYKRVHKSKMINLFDELEDYHYIKEVEKDTNLGHDFYDWE